jgi:stearoyl-CoA desaturase (delta-9 desaturase)
MNIDNDVPRMKRVSAETNPVNGLVYWSWKKSLWISFHLLVALVGGLLTFSMDSFILFLSFTAIVACLGHSLGMHRRLIHNSYECPAWLEYIFVHLGVVFGMAGPFGMMRAHDIRDWAQRHPACHDYLKHGSGFLKDGWWQLHCDLALKHAPQFVPEKRVADDRIYQFMEKTWMLQQLPWAILFFMIGGLPWVVWGISARIVVSLTGHWLIGYFAHNSGNRDWHIDGAAVQGHNIDVAGFITMGEAWHNNHHAFPGSAMLGIYKDQPDIGWWVLKALNAAGLVWDIKLPKDLPDRKELRLISARDLSGDSARTPSASLLNR